jgi:porphobilinogen deaminase
MLQHILQWLARVRVSAADLPAGARVGTSSLRRKAQLLNAHPHLRVVPVRGNVDARLQMLENGELDAIVLAAAGEAWLSSTFCNGRHSSTSMVRWLNS